MKRIFSLFLCLILIAATGLMWGCAKGENADSGKLKVVTTIFPEYDWAKEVVGEVDNVELTMLGDRGVDLHSYQPTADDILKISNCDLFIYVGGESDEWVEDAHENAENKNMKIVNLMDVLSDSIKYEELVEGMQHEHHDHDHDDCDGDHDDKDHDHDDDDHDSKHDHDDHDDHDSKHDHDDHDDHDCEIEKDEHVWLSLKNAVKITSAISEALKELDPAHKAEYTENAKAYIKKLEELDGKYQQAFGSASGKTVIFGDRFPFRYLLDDYDINYFAAFAGCSAETEASFETVTFLAKKADELKLDTILTIEGDNHKIAETVVKNTKNKNQKILIMDSMQSVSKDDIKSGGTYLKIMEKNLEVLKEALN